MKVAHYPIYNLNHGEIIMFVHQKNPPTQRLTGNAFSLLNANNAESGTTMHNVGLSAAIRDIKTALDLARAENQPQINILHVRYRGFDQTALQEYHERVKLVLKHVEDEIDLAGIQANYHISLDIDQKIVLTIWIS